MTNKKINVRSEIQIVLSEVLNCSMHCTTLTCLGSFDQSRQPFLKNLQVLWPSFVVRAEYTDLECKKHPMLLLKSLH